MLVEALFAEGAATSKGSGEQQDRWRRGQMDEARVRQEMREERKKQVQAFTKKYM
jgi:tellurite resistance protein